jgi:tetratricopeptide (TPR) repeat protein
MFKTKLKREAFLLTGLLCLTTLVSYGQQVGGDLGSSNLFKNPGTSAKPKNSSAAKIKKPAVKKPAAPAAAAPRQRNTSSKKTTARTTGDNGHAGGLGVEKPSFKASTGAKTVSANVEDLFEQSLENGNTARDARNYSGAETAYRKAQGLKPDDSRAAYGLGNLYSDLQRWEESEKNYRKAIDLDPSAPEAYIALSFVLAQPIAGADVADRYVEAEKMARKAIGLDRSNAVAYDQLGTALELQGKIGADAENAYRKAGELAPGYALPYAHLGRLKGRNNQPAESRAAFQKAQTLATDVPSMILVADTLQTSKPADAEQLLRRALQMDPRNPMALFLLSDVLSRQQKMAEAEKVLRDSIQISQNSYTPNSKLGDLLLQLRRFDEAEASFLKALSTASPTEKVKLAGLQGFTGVGDGYMAVRKHRDAVRAYTKAKELDPKNQEIAGKLTGAERVAF